MSNLLIPAAVAGIVFITFLLLLMKSITSEGSQRRKMLLGQMQESNRISDLSAEADVNLLKGTPGSGTSFFDKLPGIGAVHNALIKAGLWEKRLRFFLAASALFALTAILLRKIGPVSLMVALVVTYILPMKYLSYRINKRNAKFLDMFPDAVDLIVRSVRSGHPINTAIRMIAENMESPVRDEFRLVTDEVAYGRTLPEALKRMSKRLVLSDVDFFVVVLSVQQETGGSLTEVLTNLSSIIRKRKQLRAKIHAMTSEGRATSYILGAIPVVEFSALYYMTPSYLEPLFTTFTGNVMLGISISLIVASQLIIRQMIDIDI